MRAFLRYSIVCAVFGWLFTIPSTADAQLVVKRLMVPEGLPQTQVNGLDSDSLGHLWLGTISGGAASFDGIRFKNLGISEGLPNNIILDLVTTPKGVWFATEVGMSFYNGSELRNITMDVTKRGYPVRVFVSGDTLYFRTRDGRLGYVWANTPVMPDSAYAGEVGSVIHSLRDISVVLHRGASVKIRVIERGHSRWVNSNGRIGRIYAAFRYKGNLCVSTNDGVYSIAGSTLEPVASYTHPIYYYNEVTGDFFGVKDQRLCLSNGVKERKLDDFAAIVAASHSDEPGVVWLATDRGLYKIAFPAFEPVDDGGSEEPSMSLANYGDELWMGTIRQGIRVIKNDRIVRTIDLGGGLKNFVVSAKPTTGGSMFLGTAVGFAVWNHQRVTWGPPTMGSCSALAVGNDGRAIFASAGQGAFWIDATGKAEPIESLTGQVIQSIDYNEVLDTFVFGTNSGMIAMRDGEVRKLDVPDFEGVQLSAIRWRGDQVIVGSYGHGLYFYSYRENKVIGHINESTGLSSNTVFSVYPDKDRVWVGTIRGIDLLDTRGGQVTGLTHFGEVDGLRELETNQDVVIRHDSSLYFGLVTGLVRYTGFVPRYTNPLHLEGVRLFFNQPVSVGREVPEFSHDQNHLTFDFSMINKRSPELTYYRYVLQGFDQVWSNPSQVNSVTYGNLPYGNYELVIAATDRSGKFEYDRITYHFIIHPAFYQQAWFKVLIGVFMVAALVIGFRVFNRVKVARAVRLEELKESERSRLRKEIARDFHDELGNQTARMINYMGVLRLKNELAKNVYETLNHYSQSILNGTKDFVWALDPANDELSNIILHLKDFGEQMFVEKEVDFRFFGDANIARHMTMGYGRQINLIFKEAMTNAFRHSCAKKVELRCTLEADLVTISFSDNGKGIPVEKLDSSNGLQNMRWRAKRIGAELRVLCDGEGRGTTIELRLPLLGVTR